MLRRKLRELVPAGFCHICLPVRASKHIATKSFDLPVMELMKILPFEIIGVAELGPGRGMTQETFSVWLQAEGRLTSFVEPLKNGPLHCGQSVARHGIVKIMLITIVDKTHLSNFISLAPSVVITEENRKTMGLVLLIFSLIEFLILPVVQGSGDFGSDNFPNKPDFVHY